ncbi:hypothetical protein [Kitasatospora sp. NPDC093102]|uniref:hypothetical protein n=1 Tax=Kitasatospora sp. NPDC093102 TaxID=3155069 RepID=UPI00343FEE9D
MTAAEGRFPQRAVVTVRGAAPVEIPGEVGAVNFVEAESWQLDLEHRDQGEWYPNVRAVQGRWQEIRGVLTQVVHSRNQDRAGDRQDRNLVLRIERVVPGPGVRTTTSGGATWTTTSSGTAAPARTATTAGSWNG